MPYFYFVLLGQNIIVDRQGADPVVGFVAMRGCKAESQQAAEKLVKIQLLKQWKQIFNKYNKTGTPALTIAYQMKIVNPFKKVRSQDDFQLFSDDSIRDELIDNAVKAGKGWFSIR